MRNKAYLINAQTLLQFTNYSISCKDILNSVELVIRHSLHDEMFSLTDGLKNQWQHHFCFNYS